MNGNQLPQPMIPKNFQTVMIKSTYELMPAFPFEFGVLTLPLPRFYMRLLQDRGW